MNYYCYGFNCIGDCSDSKQTSSDAYRNQTGMLSAVFFKIQTEGMQAEALAMGTGTVVPYQMPANKQQLMRTGHVVQFWIAAASCIEPHGPHRHTNGGRAIGHSKYRYCTGKQYVTHVYQLPMCKQPGCED